MVENKEGYFRNTALNLDKFANREFRTFWNKTLRIKGGYDFGRENETLSSALGKNELLGALTRTAKMLVWVLNKIEKDHCLNAIDDNSIKTTMSKLNAPTPVLNTFLWKLGSFVYALIILFNQNANMVSGLGLTEKTENYIKIFGVVSYFLFTYFNFNQSALKSKKN
ncbi:hypothetical protein SAMN05443667_101243 [Flavobacterium gillisiae]|uniref:Uncharacterized protein n=2 Tax=Flavobacterium gillisiae TaxID=150146 RepID=A0A1H3WU11_9FLAO|nr:hypothetical protein SAMN05443667_101243 [Flavobacterium gillisiae]